MLRHGEVSKSVPPILGIDPGPKESAWVLLEYDGTMRGYGLADNHLITATADDDWIMERGAVPLRAIEDFVPYGQRLSYESLDTIRWIGRFDPLCSEMLIPRPDIRAHLCGQKSGVGDPDIRQALIRRFGGTTVRDVKGTKKNPGPLYGVKGHIWSALAVAVTARDRLREGLE